MITINGSVGANGKSLVTGMPVNTNPSTVLKIAFENNTAGTNLALCAGTVADFTAGNTGRQLSASGGPGFQFLTLVDTHQLAGKVIYVLRAAGSAVSQFTLTVE
jgi:hypothetical protein